MTDSIPALKCLEKFNLFTHFRSILNHFKSITESISYIFYHFRKKTSVLWDGLNQFHKIHQLYSHFTTNQGWLHTNHIQCKSIYITDYFGDTYS